MSLLFERLDPFFILIAGIILTGYCGSILAPKSVNIDQSAAVWEREHPRCCCQSHHEDRHHDEHRPRSHLGPQGHPGRRLGPDVQPPADPVVVLGLLLHCQDLGTPVHEGQEALRAQKHADRLQRCASTNSYYWFVRS